jgi:pimeloyl-ACP methyl ester carboxylesterase
MDNAPAIRPPVNVYFLHGLMGTCLLHCRPQIRAWRTRYRVITIDLPGHGRCRADAVYPYFANSLEFVHSVIAQFGRGHIVGVSYLGGAIALRAALLYPELLRSLILTGYVSDVPQESFAAWVQGIGRLAERNAVMAAEFDRIHGPRWRATLEILGRDCRDNYCDSIATSESMFDELKVPTLIVNGTLKLDERVAAANLPARNTLVDGGLIPGAGHLVTQDQPELFNLMVENFWAGKRIVDLSRSCGDLK